MENLKITIKKAQKNSGHDRDGTLYDEDDDRVIISESVDNNFDDISFSENKDKITITEVDEDEIIRTN
jgi:hypothetical protein